MLSIISMVILAFACVFVLPGYSIRPYRTPRNTLLAVAGYLLMGYWLFFGPSVASSTSSGLWRAGRTIYFEPEILTLSLALFGWWFLCSLMSPRKDIALRNFVKFTMVACFGLFLVTGTDSAAALTGYGGQEQGVGLILLVSAALINSIYAIVQHTFKWEPLKGLPTLMTPFQPRGLVGNPNMLASYLVPHVFFVLYLIHAQSLIWTVALAPVLYALWLTECRGAFFGLVCGLIIYGDAVSEIPFLLIGCGGVVFYLIKGGKSGRRALDKNSINERWNYWTVAVEQVIRTPLFGLGFDVLKSRVPFLQRDIDMRTGGKFLKQENYQNPWPQKAHNDYLQHITDNGIPGLMLLLCFIVVALFMGIESQDTLALMQGSALVALLANGIFFHTFHVTNVNIVFWYLIGSLTRQIDGGQVGYYLAGSPAVSVAGLPAVCLAGYIIFGYFVYKYSVRHLITDFSLDRYMRSKDYRYLDRALRCNGGGTRVNALVTVHHLNKNDLPMAYKHAARCAVFCDGDLRLWDMWLNLGTVLFRSGSLLLAKSCYEAALTFWPEHREAKAGIERIEGIEEQVEGIRLKAEGEKKAA